MTRKDHRNPSDFANVPTAMLFANQAKLAAKRQLDFERYYRDKVRHELEAALFAIRNLAPAEFDRILDEWLRT